jgi:glutamate---cysteine ligase / carboxylate-amine ligase
VSLRGAKTPGNLMTRIGQSSYPDSGDEKPGAEAMRARFDAVAPLTIGLEEEVMLVDRGSLDLLHRAEEVVERAADARFKLELPASQLEIVLPPSATVGESIAALDTARRDLSAAADGIGLLLAAGAHPFAAPVGRLSDGERYRAIAREYGDVARLQLVCALQVHIAVGGHERTLAVYNALRSHLPELAALAANAPFYAGRDTGLASVRPQISDLLPRQGVPPAIASWDDYADALRWGGFPPEQWWWELRPRPALGTLELRVPDAQSTIADAAAVAAVSHCLVAWLAARHDAGELEGPVPTWRIEENRWAACRHGLDAVFVDLATRARAPVRELLAQRVEALAGMADQLGCAEEHGEARRLLQANGAERQRASARGDAVAAARNLVGAYSRPRASVTPVAG